MWAQFLGEIASGDGFIAVDIKGEVELVSPLLRDALESTGVRILANLDALLAESDLLEDADFALLLGGGGRGGGVLATAA